MINFLSKKTTLEASGNEWLQKQNAIVAKNIAANKKISPDEILHEALQEILDSKIEEFNEEVKQMEDVYVCEPNVNIITLTGAQAKCEINFVYYTNEELSKIKYEPIKVNFNYKTISQQDIQNAFNKFCATYPIFTPIPGPIAEGDYVYCSYKIVKKGQVIEENPGIEIKAKSNQQYILNNFIIGKKVGESQNFNDPENNNWTVAIMGAKRALPTQLTNMNVAMTNLPGIKTIDDLWRKFYHDVIKENAEAELLRYYELVADKLIEKNQIRVSPALLVPYYERYVKQFLNSSSGNEQSKGDILMALENKTPEGMKIMDSANKYALHYGSMAVINDYIFNVEKLNVSKTEVDELFNEIDRSFTTEQLKNKNTLTYILKTQKIALAIARKNNETFVKQIAQDMGIKF